MNHNLQFRQGDLLFIAVETIPGVARKLDYLVIAEGEATGHMHEILEDSAVLYEDGNVKFLEILAESAVVHPEHKPIVLPPGTYEVRRQREYHPEAVRRVKD
jgi:hypothetical protein